ncbi:unnamed protein product [Prunus brigantina]
MKHVLKQQGLSFILASKEKKLDTTTDAEWEDQDELARGSIEQHLTDNVLCNTIEDTANSQGVGLVARTGGRGCSSELRGKLSNGGNFRFEDDEGVRSKRVNIDDELLTVTDEERNGEVLANSLGRSFISVWVLDSCCSLHVWSNRKEFDTYEEREGSKISSFTRKSLKESCGGGVNTLKVLGLGIHRSRHTEIDAPLPNCQRDPCSNTGRALKILLQQ